MNSNSQSAEEFLLKELGPTPLKEACPFCCEDRFNLGASRAKIQKSLDCYDFHMMTIGLSCNRKARWLETVRQIHGHFRAAGVDLSPRTIHDHFAAHVWFKDGPSGFADRPWTYGIRAREY